MTRILQQNRPFFLGFCYWLILGAILQLFFTQNEIILWINEHHSPFLDVVFSYGTYLGDGVCYAVCILILFVMRKKREGYIALTAFALITGVFAYYLKELLRTPRPITVFANQLQNIHLVQGVKVAEWFSFPSGHALSAFSIFMILSSVVKNKNWGYFFILLSVFVAYSRMYLFQHFMVDVYAGSIFGVGFTALITYFFERKMTR